MPIPPPTASPTTGLRALQAMWQQQHVLAALSCFHAELGNVFRINLPGFRPVMLVGPAANQYIFITAREQLLWRSESDPITHLLRQGLLVVDGEVHDVLRQAMTPAFHRRMLSRYVADMSHYSDQVMTTWPLHQPFDLLPQIRQIALLILVNAMFKTDFTPEMSRLWGAVVKTLDYISPGLWLFWPHLPRPGYRRAIQQLDHYLRQIIHLRRAQPITNNDDLLGLMIYEAKLNDELIRDQMFTMLVAGHDTSTSALAWAVYLLGQHPDIQQQIQAELDSVLGKNPPTFENLKDLSYLEQVLNETLRLYPPLHLGNRRAEVDLEFQGYHIAAGTRVCYSPYLTHRDPQHWPEPHRFDPERFAASAPSPAPYSFIPFGGGRRICLGNMFAMVEMKVILARLLQRFTLHATPAKIHLHMGVTLEPRPGVTMRLEARR